MYVAKALRGEHIENLGGNELCGFVIICAWHYRVLYHLYSDDSAHLHVFAPAAASMPKYCRYKQTRQTSGYRTGKRPRTKSSCVPNGIRTATNWPGNDTAKLGGIVDTRVKSKHVLPVCSIGERCTCGESVLAQIVLTLLSSYSSYLAATRAKPSLGTYLVIPG